MKEVEKLSDENIYIELANIIRIGNKAINKAKEENAKLGIPDTFWKNGNVYYVLITGEVTLIPPPIMCD